jgi:NAD(P)-dependent dehydrogenase (short-subunit alcohol dehydrogenase family)
MGGFQGSSKFPGLSAYSASKGALGTLTECLAVEFSGKGISVNALALGAVQTEMLSQAFPGYEAPISANKMADFITNFALNGHQFFNGKQIPVAFTTP